jgi:apolipoprotein N-acyltransferase
MDIRDTIVTAESFFPILLQHFKSHNKVSLLIDKDGITRAEGYITNIESKDNVLNSIITLSDQTIFQIKDLIAVNGLFKSDYSEC